MASAFVTGAASLAWSHYNSISADEVRRRLQETAIDLGLGRDRLFGYGRIDFFSALQMSREAVGGRIRESDQIQLLLLFVIGVLLATVGVTSITLLGNARRSYPMTTVTKRVSDRTWRNRPERRNVGSKRG
jgi:hypothetical protein